MVLGEDGVGKATIAIHEVRLRDHLDCGYKQHCKGQNQKPFHETRPKHVRATLANRMPTVNRSLQSNFPGTPYGSH